MNMEVKALHTPGKLKAFGDSVTQAWVKTEDGKDFADILTNSDLEDAVRVTACWNACNGIPTEALEAGVIGDAREALGHAIEIIKRFVPVDALGHNADPNGDNVWPLRDEYLHNMQQAFSRLEGSK